MNLRGKLDNNTYFRQERNGLILYYLQENFYRFYENIFITSKEDLEQFNFSAMNISSDAEIQYPICVCCLAENKCNLDCIYCFGDDKMYEKDGVMDVRQKYAPLIDLNPIQVSLGGGEPTLNPQIKEIIALLSENEIAIVLDTNGTTDILKDLIPVLKKAGALVRVSIDSLEDSVIEKVRPFKGKKLKSPSETIEKNIDLLLSNDIRMAVHTVLTQINKESVTEIEKFILRKGICRWHIDGVKYSEKCKEYFDDISVSEEELRLVMKLLDNNKQRINVTYSYEADSAPNVRLFFDVNGKLLVDSVYNGLQYIKLDNNIENIYQYLDKKRHIERYLGNYYL